MNSNIAMIPFANMAPVRKLGCPGGFAFIYLTPRQSVEALADGRVVAAALPTGALLQADDHVEPLGNYGVAASGAVGSVLLYSKKSIESLGPSDRVHLTEQSATSVILLYLVLRGMRSGKAMPSPSRGRRTAASALIIGDEAMSGLDKSEYPFCYDLATLWYERFQKPMVFCRWMVRSDAPADVKSRLLAWLGELDTRDDQLVAECAATEARRLGISRSRMVAYLKGMRRVLNKDDVAGQSCFLREAKCFFADYLEWRKEAKADSGDSGGRPRLDRGSALRLMRDAPLGEVMAAAHAERMRRHPGGLVSFVVDTNPNYTNICNTHCTFCAFHRDAGSEEAYTLSGPDLAARVRAAWDRGATTVLLQGGSHPGIDLALMVGYIREIRSACPGIHIHPFSPSEIDAVARLEKKPVEYILKALWDEGVHTIPGGVAEIL